MVGRPGTRSMRNKDDSNEDLCTYYVPYCTCVTLFQSTSSRRNSKGHERRAADDRQHRRQANRTGFGAVRARPTHASSTICSNKYQIRKISPVRDLRPCVYSHRGARYAETAAPLLMPQQYRPSVMIIHRHGIHIWSIPHEATEVQTQFYQD